MFALAQTAALLYTIAFKAFPPSDTDIFIAAGDGTAARPLAPDPALDYNASFSPDGHWIVFTSHRAGSADLYRIHADGSGLERLTDDPAFDDQGTFSPDGKRLAFVSTRRGQADIWTLDLENAQGTARYQPSCWRLPASVVARWSVDRVFIRSPASVLNQKSVE